MGSYILTVTCLLAAITPSFPSPIMVQFGTKGGPIVPPAPTTSKPEPRSYNPPAPVWETPDDIPNPSTYTPISPTQYRTKIYKYKPQINAVGTALDKKYQYNDKYVIYRKPRKFGVEYSGPQTFEVQDYEREQYQNRNQNVALFQPIQKTYEPRRTQVPAMGVFYSSGVRYYVPQVMYYSRNYDDIDNSVYEANDLKYYQNKYKSY